MTFLSVRQPQMRHQAFQSEVIDLNTGEKIPRVIWANDETGRYRQYLTDENGMILVTHQKTVSKVFSGNIKIVPKNIDKSVMAMGGHL